MTEEAERGATEKPPKTPEELAAIAYLDKLRTCEGEAMSARPSCAYTANGFKSWSSRHSESDGIDYDQMLCVLNASASGHAYPGFSGIIYPESSRDP